MLGANSNEHVQDGFIDPARLTTESTFYDYIDPLFEEAASGTIQTTSSSPAATAQPPVSAFDSIDTASPSAAVAEILQLNTIPWSVMLATASSPPDAAAEQPVSACRSLATTSAAPAPMAINLNTSIAFVPATATSSNKLSAAPPKTPSPQKAPSPTSSTPVNHISWGHILEQCEHGAGHFTHYRSLKEAEQDLTGKEVVVPHDPTIPETEGMKCTVVNLLSQAFKSTETAVDSEKVISPFRHNRYRDEEIEKVCWQILVSGFLVFAFVKPVANHSSQETMIEHHRTDFNVGGVLAYKTAGKYANFHERLVSMLESLAVGSSDRALASLRTDGSLQDHKSMCKHLLEPLYLRTVIDDPVGAANRIKNNKNVNAKKSNIINIGRRHLPTGAAVKGKARSTDSSSLATSTTSSKNSAGENTIPASKSARGWASQQQQTTPTPIARSQRVSTSARRSPLLSSLVPLASGTVPVTNPEAIVLRLPANHALAAARAKRTNEAAAPLKQLSAAQQPGAPPYTGLIPISALESKWQRPVGTPLSEVSGRLRRPHAEAPADAEAESYKRVRL
ncbi:hypothetical protein N7510_007966 [Penicillium lagena]|uniref:uncharacterized protein n=1 Tax=Penicillium lagena TaxID=94218 RepID=UPI002541359C|nr:uncharacterized protein N7510_007966 [Penicillium lagena]KAJ5611247.1 hypothetical protein N7510_007966 [Penicillium lagena]